MKNERNDSRFSFVGEGETTGEHGPRTGSQKFEELRDFARAELTYPHLTGVEKLAHAQQQHHGLILQWRAGKVQREVALEAFRRLMQSQFTVLSTVLDAREREVQAAADLHLQEVLMRLEGERMKLVQQFGIVNQKGRMESIRQLTDAFVEEVNAAHESGWAEPVLAIVKKRYERLWLEAMDELSDDLPSRYARVSESGRKDGRAD